MSVSFVAILVIACGMALLAKRLKLPYTVLLVVAGLAATSFEWDCAVTPSRAPSNALQTMWSQC